MKEYPIPDLPEYFVTEDGKVISRKHGRYLELKVLRKFTKRGSGTRPRLQVCFTTRGPDGKVLKVTKQLHQVILAGKYNRWPEPWEQCRHLDSNPMNNYMGKLEYGCCINNLIDDLENGTRQTDEANIRSAIKRLEALLP